MNMLDVTQFSLNKSETTNKDTEFGIIYKEKLLIITT